VIARSKTPQAKLAHKLTIEAIKSGKLVKEPCEICESIDQIVAHHPDYERPLDVRWLCNPCHMKLHALMRWPTRSIDRPMTHRGKTLTIEQWAIGTGLNPFTLEARIFRLDWPIELALELKVRQSPPGKCPRIGKIVRAARETLVYLVTPPQQLSFSFALPLASTGSPQPMPSAPAKDSEIGIIVNNVDEAKRAVLEKNGPNPSSAAKR
jgi:hypothetical protein